MLEKLWFFFVFRHCDADKQLYKQFDSKAFMEGAVNPNDWKMCGLLYSQSMARVSSEWTQW